MPGINGAAGMAGGSQRRSAGLWRVTEHERRETGDGDGDEGSPVMARIKVGEVATWRTRAIGRIVRDFLPAPCWRGGGHLDAPSSFFCRERKKGDPSNNFFRIFYFKKINSRSPQVRSPGQVK